MRWRAAVIVSMLAGVAWAASDPRTGLAREEPFALSLSKGLTQDPFALSLSKGLQPSIEKPTKGAQCVEDTATMRRDHMRMLEHTRDRTVHGGIRGAKYSLKGCIDCHASAKTGSVAQAPGDFCVACHQYAAVKIDCFECHASTRGGVATKTAEVKRP